MKNVVGLANAMRTVESACEKGEITIIGEGGLPSPVELYNKCVAFINRNYGVDILNLVAQTAMRKDCGDCCCDCCCNDEEDEPIVFEVDKVESYLEAELPKIMPYLDKDCIRKIVVEIVDYCDNENADDTVRDLTNNILSYNIGDILSDTLDNISYETCIEIGKKLGVYIGNHCLSI
jgi:hypothetical protein